MPFTFSHPAIVLPLILLPRHCFSLTGLIIRSLNPDLEYFLRMKIQSNYSHTIFGLFWLDLPLGILLAYIFHNIVRDNLFDNLPKILKYRLVKFQQFEWNEYFKRNWLIVIISILIGAGSHILWDGFTHKNGYFVRTIPSLTNKIELYGRQIPTFKIFQHSSTLVGGIVIAIALFKLTPHQTEIGNDAKIYWSIVSVITFTIITVRLLTGLDYNLFGHLVATGISAGLIALTLTPMILSRIK